MKNKQKKFSSIFMCEASHMKFDLVFHQFLQVYMYENVTSGPSHNRVGPNITYKLTTGVFGMKLRYEYGGQYDHWLLRYRHKT